jgi:phosphate transport system permease protein
MALTDDRPRALGRASLDDRASTWMTLGGSLALVWVLYERVLPWSGALGFLVLWWAAFLVLLAAVSAVGNPLPAVVDRVASALVWSGALVVVGALASAIGYTFYKGHRALLYPNFYTHDMAGVLPSAGLDHGGISHALVGTAIEVGLATAIALPLGIGTGVYLTEVGGRMSSVVRTVVEAMTALPDVLAGLFVYAVLILALGWDKTGLAVSVALAVTMVPVVARSCEVVLRIVPGVLREASLALGASRWRTVWNVVLPTARSGLATSLILGIARITGETAPLLIVSGSSTFFNDNPLHEPMNSLPLFTFAAIKSGQQGPVVDRAYGAALVLLIFVLVLFVLARFLARDKSGRR